MPPPTAILRFGTIVDAGRDAVVVQLQLRNERPIAVAYGEIHDAQLELLVAAIGDAKVAVHRLPVQRPLQERLGRYDRDLQRLCEGAGQQEDVHGTATRDATKRLQRLE